MRENCIDCMFSENTESTMMINDLMDSSNFNYVKCNHHRSPYYDELVDEQKSCRLFLDTEKYFLKKDRKDKLDELNRNDRKL